MEMIPLCGNIFAQIRQIGYKVQENLLPKEDAVMDNHNNNSK